MRAIKTVFNYIEVLKPLPTLLLAFIGVAAAALAADGALFPRLLLVLAAILIATAGANGLTNYLDRDVDARMPRTRQRALPSKRIRPPQKVLPLIILLIAAGLALAWIMHPLAFAADLVGTAVAGTWRKRVTCVYPQGVIASCAPLVMGWFAIKPAFGWEIALLCLLVAAWLPLHVWSLTISHREEYRQAGLSYFPINADARSASRVLLIFACLLFGVSLVLYFVAAFGWLYLGAALLLGALMLYSSLRLLSSGAAADAWRMYRLSTYPYLGLMFLVMLLDTWLGV